MAVYYYLLILLPLSVASILARNRAPGAIVLLILALCTIIISAFRWMSDIDHVDYLEMYAETPVLANFNPESIRDLHGEPGYLLLTAIFKTLGLSFPMLSMVCAVFAITAKAWVASRFSRGASLALCLYLCVHFVTIEFIQIRWAVASAFIVLAFYMQFKRSLFTAASFFLLAITFHYFAAIFALVMMVLEIKKQSLFYIMIVAILLFGIFISRADGSIELAIASDVYVVKRTIRYLIDPLSNVGILSYLRLAMVPLAFFFCTRIHPSLFLDSTTLFLKRITFLSISFAFLFSFVPLMHFRAVVIADFFSFLLLCRMIDVKMPKFTMASILIIFSVLYLVWFVADIGNYVSADRLYEYRTWL